MDIESALKTIGDWISKETESRKYPKGELLEISESLQTLKTEIARQSVKSEEVAEAINEFESAFDGEVIVNGLVGVVSEYQFKVETIDLVIAALQAYQLWVPVSERLPEIPEGRYGVTCNVMVDNCSSTKVMSLLYEKDTVRGKTVCRWKWYGKISPWNVTHWKPLTKPPKGE